MTQDHKEENVAIFYLVGGDESEVGFLIVGVEQDQDFDVARLRSGTSEVNAARVSILIVTLKSHF